MSDPSVPRLWGTEKRNIWGLEFIGRFEAKKGLTSRPCAKNLASGSQSRSRITGEMAGVTSYSR